MCVCVFAPAGCEGVITHSSWGKRQRRRLGRERGGRETKSTNSRHKRDFRSAAEKQNKKSTDLWFQSSVCLSLWRGCVDRFPPGVSAGAPVPSPVDRIRGEGQRSQHIIHCLTGPDVQNTSTVLLLKLLNPGCDTALILLMMGFSFI